MADNRLLGTGGMYYNNNEIGKAYLGNNLVWEKGPDYDPNYMLKMFNGYSSYGSSGMGPELDITNANNYKIQIGIKDLGSYALYSSVGYVLGSAATGTGVDQPLCVASNYVYIGGPSNNNYKLNLSTYTSKTYLEFEIVKGTSNYSKCLTTNQTLNTTPLSYNKIIICPAVGTSYAGRCYCSFHYVKIWSNGIMIHDVHAKKFSDTSRGFIDVVTGITYTKENGGIGSVTLSDDSI